MMIANFSVTSAQLPLIQQIVKKYGLYFDNNPQMATRQINSGDHSL